MGIEHQLTCNKEITEAEFAEVINGLSQQVNFITKKTSENRIQLKWYESSVNKGWESDIDIELNKSSIFILFNSGTQFQRDNLLNYLLKELQKKDILCESEEL